MQSPELPRSGAGGGADASTDGAPSATHAKAAKKALREELVAARRRRSVAQVGEEARALTAHVLDLPEVRRAATVAVYVSLATEPGTGALLSALRAAGKRVLLPVVLPDLDLDWAVYVDDASLREARRGLLEPVGERLGVEAIGTADVVLLPGMAVSSDGSRLGQGGGCYDRALARVPTGTFTCVLLYDDEVGLDVPAEAHDRRVAAAATPRGVTRFG